MPPAAESQSETTGAKTTGAKTTGAKNTGAKNTGAKAWSEGLERSRETTRVASPLHAARSTIRATQRNMAYLTLLSRRGIHAQQTWLEPLRL
jgi:hypothetical protein